MRACSDQNSDRRWAWPRASGHRRDEAAVSNLAPGIFWSGSDQDLKLPNKKFSTFVPIIFLYYRKHRRWLKSQFFFGKNYHLPTASFFGLAVYDNADDVTLIKRDENR